MSTEGEESLSKGRKGQPISNIHIDRAIKTKQNMSETYDIVSLAKISITLS